MLGHYHEVRKHESVFSGGLKPDFFTSVLQKECILGQQAQEKKTYIILNKQLIFHLFTHFKQYALKDLLGNFRR